MSYANPLTEKMLFCSEKKKKRPYMQIRRPLLYWKMLLNYDTLHLVVFQRSLLLLWRKAGRSNSWHIIDINFDPVTLYQPVNLDDCELHATVKR